MINNTLNDALLRHFIGLDHFARLAQGEQQSINYPPFNIEQIGEDQYVLTLAVAGFNESELSISLLNSMLTVTGKKTKPQNQSTYLHRGLSFRDFERTFTLAEHVQVVYADLTDGMLTINLERQVPESAKPRNIPIGSILEAPKTETLLENTKVSSEPTSLLAKRNKAA